MSFIIVVLCLALLIVLISYFHCVSDLLYLGGHRFGHSVGEAAGLGE